jgi:hypothetical protein
MKRLKIGIVLLTFLLAGMVLVPGASAYRADNWGPNYGLFEDFSNAAYNAAVKQSSMGYAAYYDSDNSASTAWDNLPSDQVFSFNGHGNNGGIIFSDDTWIYANNPGSSQSISSLTGGQLNDLALAVFVNCNSGYGTSNLLTSTVGHGGDAAIGFTGEITKAQSDYWTGRLWYYLDQSYSIQNAANMAQSDTLSSYWYAFGGIDTMTYQQSGSGYSRVLDPAVAGV